MLKYMKSKDYRNDQATARIVKEFIEPYMENETINIDILKKDVEKLVKSSVKPVVITGKKWIG